jgi:hypothetical protein
MLSTTCAACGNRRKFRNLSYDQKLNAYCQTHQMCNKYHPNSPQNCLKRGTFVELMDSDDAKDLYLKQQGATYKSVVKDFGGTPNTLNLARLVKGSISFRMRKEIHSEYLTYIAGKINAQDISSVMIHILEQALEKDRGFASHMIKKSEDKQEIITPVVPYVEPKQLPTEYMPKIEEVPAYSVVDDEEEFIL